MKYRTLGHSNLEVSEIGVGCWEAGGEYGAFDEEGFIRAVNEALDLGVTMFDTAWAYGWGAAESLLGKALGSRRDHALICTKIGVCKGDDGQNYFDSSRATLMRTLEESLRALGTDHVDLLLIHWPDRSRPFDEAMDTLAQIQASGKAGQVGVSNFSSQDLRACEEAAPGLVVTNQVGYNLFDRRWEREMFPFAAEHHISIMAYGPLAHGLLSGQVAAGATFAKNDWRASGKAFGQPIFEGDNLEKNVAVAAQLAQLASDLHATLPQLALAWVLNNPVVATALTGVRSPAEIDENAAASSLVLEAATIQQIEDIMANAAGQLDEVPK